MMNIPIVGSIVEGSPFQLSSEGLDSWNNGLRSSESLVALQKVPVMEGLSASVMKGSPSASVMEGSSSTTQESMTSSYLLKRLQKISSFTVSSPTVNGGSTSVSVKWNPETRFFTKTEDFPVDNEQNILTKLNTIAARIRSTRRPFGAQLRTVKQREFAQNIYQSISNSGEKCADLGVVDGGRVIALGDLQNLLGCQPYSSVDVKNEPMIVYGFDQVEEKISSILQQKGFRKLQIIGDYNSELNIGEDFNFKGYINLIKKNSFPERKDEIDNTDTYEDEETLLDDSFISYCYNSDEFMKWKNFILEKLSRFNFANKLTTKEGRKRFLIKNFRIEVSDLLGFDNFEGVPIYIKFFFKEKNINYLDQVVNYFEASFKLLKKVFETNESFNNIENEYNELDEVQKLFLNSIVPMAFLRITSLLGIEFAAREKVPVIVAWQGPGDPSIEALHKLLERETYNGHSLNFYFKKDGDNPEIWDPTMKAITLSEMGHMGKLQESTLPNEEPLPIILPLRIIPEGEQKTVNITSATLPQKGNQKMGIAKLTKKESF